jgi:hypothetical protein
VGRGRTSLYHYDAGQAIMLYPDPSGAGLPLACLRLKLLKKGIDDFEYLHLLETRLEERARKRGVRDPHAEAQGRVRELASKLVRDMNSYVLDSAVLESVRGKIAEEIDTAGRP